MTYAGATEGGEGERDVRVRAPPPAQVRPSFRRPRSFSFGGQLRSLRAWASSNNLDRLLRNGGSEHLDRKPERFQTEIYLLWLEIH